MAFAPHHRASPSLHARLMSVPVHTMKEAAGFAVFFSSHSYLMSWISLNQWRVDLGSTDAGETFAPRVRAVFASTVAGALAGVLYHIMTYPVEHAKQLAGPDTNVTSVQQTIRSHGWLSLYRGCARTSAKGFFTGAVTFGAFEAARQTFED